MFKNFLRDVRGNFAIVTAVLAVPLLMSVGLYIDYARQTSAHSHVQALADIAALQMAGLHTTDMAVLRAAAERAINANQDPDTVQQVEISSLELDGQQIAISLKGKIDTTFLRLANNNEAGVQAHATAERGLNGQVEVALVLDNTYSMIGADGTGTKKIDALKTAANELVTRLMSGNATQIKIGIVPYADYVNVGTSNRNASWLDIPDDHTDPGTPASCVTHTTQNVCTSWNPTYSCTYYTDGVPSTGTCGGGCTQWTTETVPPYQVCTPQYGPYLYTWHGCVGSRFTGNARLDDQSPSIKYPGFTGYYQQCPTPITPLTASTGTLHAAIDAMSTNTSVYYPSTYIPSGMIWGQNILSPKKPFNEGKNYDANNIAPRKVVVLMTDGDNTLKYWSADGRHVPFTVGNETTDRQQADGDTQAICNYMKSNKIEIFSVAFMVSNTQAKSLLESCASDPAHYFDASDSAKLLDSFQKISDSLAMVRLVK